MDETSFPRRLDPAPLPGASGEMIPAFPAGILERMIGKPAADWTAEDLVELVRFRGIRLVSLMHVGGDGWPKTLDFVPGSVSHLRDILSGGERADGSSLFGDKGIRSGASDIILRPNLRTAFLDPFSPLPTLVVLCGHAGRDGSPLPQSPDTIVRRADARVRETAGVELLAHGEVEFFLGRKAGENDIYGVRERGYHASSPFVFGEALRRRAMATLAGMGVPVKYGHSEVGYIEAAEDDGWTWEQHEIELCLQPLPQAADGVVLTHWVLRNLAREHGMRCSLDPIVRPGHAGTGLHFHFAPVEGGEHRGGRRADGTLHEPAQWLIGGLVQAGGALMAFGNRVEGSFTRLTQGREAPRGIIWGDSDRNALVRLPAVASTGDGRVVTHPTVEFRLPDGSAHPHLVLAGCAQAMLLGRSTQDLGGLLARTRAGAGPDGGAASVPRGFAEVASALEERREAFEAGGIFPRALLDLFIAGLRARGARG